jgi:hypothetical protein
MYRSISNLLEPIKEIFAGSIKEIFAGIYKRDKTYKDIGLTHLKNKLNYDKDCGLKSRIIQLTV